METKLTILLLEDNPDDAELIEMELRAAQLSFNLRRVDNRAALVHQIKNSNWDVILADYALPCFSGPEILDCLREESCDIPVILVTGSLSERLAADLVQPGIEDFILKDRLNRLPLAIRKVVERKSLKRQQSRIQFELRQSREQLRALTAKLQAAREAESVRIAREIHDELGQGLTGTKLELAKVSLNLRPTNPSAAAKLEDIEQTINELTRSVQRIATELRPGVLDDLGLGAAMSWQIRKFGQTSGLSCRYESELPDQRLPEEISTALFRILQESLTNVARHAQATHVEVLFTEANGTLILKVCDDGRGVSPKAVAAPNALGILGMQERARLLGGSCEIEGQDGRGTTVLTRIPRR